MRHYFDQATQSRITTMGAVDLPIFYYNTTAVFISYLVNTEQATALLPKSLEPLRMGRSKTMATVAFFQYMDSSVGAYNEMGLAIAARPQLAHYQDRALWQPHRALLPGMFVVDLPVTTPLANAAGRELWGYPKIVVPIEVSVRGHQLDCTVQDEQGRVLCHVLGRSSLGFISLAPNLMTYTMKAEAQHSTLVRTLIQMYGSVRNAAAGSVRLQVGQGEHPLIRHLQQLGLDGARPILVQSGLGLRAVLPEGMAVC